VDYIKYCGKVVGVKVLPVFNFTATLNFTHVIMIDKSKILFWKKYYTSLFALSSLDILNKGSMIVYRHAIPSLAVRVYIDIKNRRHI